MLRIAVLAPIDNSLYARLVAGEISRLEGVELCAIVVRNHWNWRRFKNEFSRDGVRLLGKIQQKYILGDSRFDQKSGENLSSLANKTKLDIPSLKVLARQKDIPYRMVKDLNDPASETLLNRTAPDLIAFTGGGLIRKNILAVPAIGILNCHTGILPQYRGMDVVEWTAIEKNMDQVGFGVTLHLMDQGVDSGPIITKKTIALLPNDRFKTVRERLEVAMVELMVTGIRGLRDGKLKPQPQKANDGRQYYVMHPRVKACAEKILARKTEQLG
jgi:methionyl-tRNA formyltransferase